MTYYRDGRTVTTINVSVQDGSVDRQVHNHSSINAAKRYSRQCGKQGGKYRRED